MDAGSSRPVVSYAQQLEDVMLWRALRHVSNGYYVDVGASDPVIESVSLLFYNIGWRGVHVEPSSALVEKICRQRPDELVIEAAVGDRRRDDSIFYEITDSYASRGLSTANADCAEVASHYNTNVREYTVKTITMDDVFAQCERREIHWLKIDVEGNEADVIRGWSGEWRPWLVAVESVTPLENKPNYDTWEPMIERLGYQFVWSDYINRFYVHKNHPELRATFLHAPNVCDGFTIDIASGFGSHVERAMAERFGWRYKRAQTLVMEVERLTREAQLKTRYELALAETMLELEKEREARRNMANSISRPSNNPPRKTTLLYTDPAELHRRLRKKVIKPIETRVKSARKKLAALFGFGGGDIGTGAGKLPTAAAPGVSRRNKTFLRRVDELAALLEDRDGTGGDPT